MKEHPTNRTFHSASRAAPTKVEVGDLKTVRPWAWGSWGKRQHRVSSPCCGFGGSHVGSGLWWEQPLAPRVLCPSDMYLFRTFFFWMDPWLQTCFSHIPLSRVLSVLKGKKKKMLILSPDSALERPAVTPDLRPFQSRWITAGTSQGISRSQLSMPLIFQFIQLCHFY